MNGNNAKLAKLIALAASDNDAEALTAIRRARDLLQTNGRDWRDLIAVIEEARLFEEIARVTPAEVKWAEQNRDFAATVRKKWSKYLTDDDRAFLQGLLDHPEDYREPSATEAAIQRIISAAHSQRYKKAG